MHNKDSSGSAAGVSALRTRALRGELARQGLRAFALMVGCHAVALVMISLLASETVWLSVLSTVVVLALYMLIAWADGAARGEKAVAMNEMTASQRETYGREPDEQQYSRLYLPVRGLWISLGILAFSMLTVFLLGLLFYVLSLGQQDPGAFGEHLVLSARLVLSPFFGLFGLMSEGAAYILLPMGFILFPACEWAGYLNGPRQRQKVHRAIADHSERLRKKRRREQAMKKGAAVNRPPKR